MTDDDKALVERLRGDWPEILVEKHWMMDSDAIDKQREEAADRIEALSAENERLQFLCDLNAVPAGIIEDRGRKEERAAIVAWLRAAGDEVVNWMAIQIEAGEHLK